jgi:F-type H+-transporting ATPase subunit a
MRTNASKQSQMWTNASKRTCKPQAIRAQTRRPSMRKHASKQARTAIRAQTRTHAQPTDNRHKQLKNTLTDWAGAKMHEIAMGVFETPTLKDFFPDAFLFQNTPFAFNRIDLIRIIMSAALILIMCLTAKNAKVVPSRFQAAVEFLLNFIRENIVNSMIHLPKNQKRFTPMLTAIFLIVFFMNLGGIIPGLNLAGSSGIGIPLCLALWVLVTYWRVGIKERGFLKFVKYEVMPDGVPAPIYAILTPVEFTQLVFFKPFSLTIRLFANMLAGHMLMAICINATQMVFTGGWLFSPLVILGVVIIATMTCFELFVAFLQAYVFAVLSSSYIGQSLEGH